MCNLYLFLTANEVRVPTINNIVRTVPTSVSLDILIDASGSGVLNAFEVAYFVNMGSTFDEVHAYAYINLWGYA